MEKLTIVPNDTNKPPEKQFEQTSIALQAIASWSNRINSGLFGAVTFIGDAKPVIINSKNVSSVVRLGVGTYKITLSTANTNYTVLVSGSGDATFYNGPSSTSSSSFVIKVFDTTGVPFDDGANRKTVLIIV